MNNEKYLLLRRAMGNGDKLLCAEILEEVKVMREAEIQDFAISNVFRGKVELVEDNGEKWVPNELYCRPSCNSGPYLPRMYNGQEFTVGCFQGDSYFAMAAEDNTWIKATYYHQNFIKSVSITGESVKGKQRNYTKYCLDEKGNVTRVEEFNNSNLIKTIFEQGISKTTLSISTCTEKGLETETITGELKDGIWSTGLLMKFLALPRGIEKQESLGLGAVAQRIYKGEATLTLHVG